MDYKKKYTKYKQYGGNNYITLSSGEQIQCDGRLEFTGTHNHPQVDYLLYMKESLNISDKVEVLKIQTNVFKIENIIIKILLASDNPEKTCSLTSLADSKHVGAKMLGCLKIYRNNEHICTYLFTEYLQPIEKDFDHFKIREFVIKISKITELKFHPDFWYNNLCTDNDGNLKAIDWDGELYDMYEKNIINEEKAVALMLNRYSYKIDLDSKS